MAQGLDVPPKPLHRERNVGQGEDTSITCVSIEL